MNPLFGLFLFLLLFSSFFVVSFSLDPTFADKNKIGIKIFSLETTSIIEFTNNSFEDIQTIRIWMNDSFFKSFKFKDNLTVTKTSEGIIFNILESLKPQEIIKIGIKTEKSNPLIYWELVDTQGNMVEIGTIQSLIIDSLETQDQKSINNLTGILPDSTFKIIPKNPIPGFPIRVAGDNFAPNSSLELFLDDTKLKSFETNENGHFILTIIIPKKTEFGQTTFTLKDKQNHEKVLDVYLFEAKQKISKNIELTVADIQNKFYRTDVIEFSGTANIDTKIIIDTRNSNEELFSTDTINPNSKGIWNYSLHIPLDTSLDEYTTEITDGKNTIIKSWDVVLSKNIDVLPVKPQFKLGEMIQFIGTANPEEQIIVKFTDPQGNDVISKNFLVDSSGFFGIDYLTSTMNLKGTYVLYLFQNSDVEIIFVGLDEYPKIPLSAKLNHVNYNNNNDISVVGITGKNISDLKLVIHDQNGHEKFKDFIKLGFDGKRNYALKTTNFSPGIYTLLISTAGSQISEIFTVGLPSSNTSVDFNMSKKIFYPGQTILVSGISEPYTVVDLFLIDPDGLIVHEKESFINKNGALSVNNFVIPYDAKFGNWIVRSESGTKYTNFEFQVNPLEKDAQSIHVSDILFSSIGTFVTIDGFVSEKQTVKITIDDPQGNIIFTTNLITADNGDFDLLWQSPVNPISGTYLVTVEDSFKQTTNTTFDL